MVSRVEAGVTVESLQRRVNDLEKEKEKLNKKVNNLAQEIKFRESYAASFIPDWIINRFYNTDYNDSGLQLVGNNVRNASYLKRIKAKYEREARTQVEQIQRLKSEILDRKGETEGYYRIHDDWSYGAEGQQKMLTPEQKKQVMQQVAHTLHKKYENDETIRKVTLNKIEVKIVDGNVEARLLMREDYIADLTTSEENIVDFFKLFSKVDEKFKSVAGQYNVISFMADQKNPKNRDRAYAYEASVTRGDSEKDYYLFHSHFKREREEFLSRCLDNASQGSKEKVELEPFVWSNMNFGEITHCRDLMRK